MPACSCSWFGWYQPTWHKGCTVESLTSWWFSFSVFFINETVLKAGKRRLKGPHAPLGRLPHCCCFLVQWYTSNKIWSIICNWILLTRLDKKRIFLVRESGIDGTLPANGIVDLFQFRIDVSQFCHFAIVKCTWDIVATDWHGSIRAEHEHWCNIMIMSPAVVILVLCSCITSLLQVQLQPVHATPNTARPRQDASPWWLPDMCKCFQRLEPW